MTQRFNIAPTQSVPVITSDAPDTLSFLQWGLVPFWAKDARIGYKMINARSETLADKPSFKAAFRQRRCLVPADGFYEWRKEGSSKQPYYFYMPDQTVFALGRPVGAVEDTGRVRRYGRSPSSRQSRTTCCRIFTIVCRLS